MSAGDIIFLHQLLGEHLARLYLGGLLGGTKNRDAPDDEVVDNAISQRRLRSNDSKVDSLFLGYFSQRLYIGGLDINILGNLSRAGVTRSDINLFNFGALG